MDKKYKTPLEKKRDKEKNEEELYRLFESLTLFMVVLFISAFINGGAIAFFIASGSGVGNAILSAGMVTGIVACFITLLFQSATKKKNKLNKLKGGKNGRKPRSSKSRTNRACL